MGVTFYQIFFEVSVLSNLTVSCTALNEGCAIGVGDDYGAAGDNAQVLPMVGNFIFVPLEPPPGFLITLDIKN